ncbi:sugar isomerase domain-containing protein [Nonomuraea sp. NPDC050536]|uniref:sugar isomerase domain-containing protein n=1 Tax=Nonomuraea sp. NPDC050536 TaxID=3364366 RepID=UPI0037C92DDE
MSAEAYLAAATSIAARVVGTQLEAIKEAGERLADALSSGRRLWVFGTGHSHLLAEELYARAGGLADVRAVLEPALMLHEGPHKSSALERLTGLAEILVEDRGIAAGDVVIVASNSGRNAVPVEFAASCVARGAYVIAVTSLAHTRSVPSRAPSGHKLADVASLVIDNCGVPGDPPYGATSTITGTLIVQAIACEAVSRMAAPRVLRSFNVDS